MNLSDTEWEDHPAAPTGGELVDQALLVAAAKRRLTARLNKAADAQIAAALDGTTNPTAPVVPGMAAAVQQALRELEADQLEQDAVTAGAELNAAADQAAADDEPRLYYGSLHEFVGQFLVRAYRRDIPPAGRGARSGGSIPRSLPASTRCGAPGKHSGSIPRPG